MQRLTLVAAAAVLVASVGTARPAAPQAFLARPALAVDPALERARALDSLRATTRRLVAREADLAAQLAILHRDAVARALDRTGALARERIEGPRSPEMLGRDMMLRRDLFYSVLGAGLFGNAMWHFDADTYRGPRPLLDQYSGYHFTAGVTLEQLGFVMRVPARWRLLGVCATAELFEHTQGYVDHTDAALACAGAALSAAARRAFVR